jgi:alpha-amylase/alpha-mannosidase (GH57 family)
MSNKKYYLTIHGHFYQPPRENPWLETIELQDSALPFHDWNARIAYECYTPNSVSRIVNSKNQLIDIVNNYELMSFNIGPTLLSWLEVHSPKTYQRIIEADKKSLERFSGHGNALAQVYNHAIMPLCNEKDKYTQTIWGVKDFQHRFGRMPEGIWLAETAIDYDTVRVLIDCGIKYTILSPFQAQRIKHIKADGNSWMDVSWSTIDPGQAYRCYLKDDSERYIDVFFYDGSISKSVAFDELLRNGDAFIARLRDGVSYSRNYDQLVNIATDGESYGHHTTLGNMALSYILKKKLEPAGFLLTNYAEFLEKYPPINEVELKSVSSWSCFHGVGRWSEDCGCSTGAGPGWNQKWRKPLRKAFDWLRDELAVIYEKNAAKYLKDPWKARNRYIDVVLDRTKTSAEAFCKHEASKKLNQSEIVSVIKLLEMQRNAMLMYTSCGWFFADISGIETVQILKYAARAMQIAEEFQEIDLETKFVQILSDAYSNIDKFGNGKDIYMKFVKPSIVNVKQVVNHWAISSLFEDYEEETEIYCYKIRSVDCKKAKKGDTKLVIGRLEINSKVTFEQHDMIFALLHFGGEDFHCVIRGYAGKSEYNKIKDSLLEKYHTLPLTEVIRGLDEYFGKEYFTLKNLFIEERRKIINVLIEDKLTEFGSTYKNLYDEAKGPIMQLSELGLQIPEEFKIAAEYALSSSFNELIKDAENVESLDLLQSAIDTLLEAKNMGIVIDTSPTKEIYSKYITEKVESLAKSKSVKEFELFADVLIMLDKLDLKLDLSEAQNFYFNNIYVKIPQLIENMEKSKNMVAEKKLISAMLTLGEKLNISVEENTSLLNKTAAHI